MTESENSGRDRLEAAIEQTGLALRNTAEYVARLEKHGLAHIPPDARSLRLWLDRVRSLVAPAR